MNRRSFVVALASAPWVGPGRVAAQPAGTLRVGWLSSDRAFGNGGYEAFLRGMRERGYVEGRNLTVDPRWGDGTLEALVPVAAALVQSRPDMIVTQGPAPRVLLQNGTKLPIVFAFSGDPIAAGFVESFARPGRNMTGVSFLSLDLVGKRMEILKEALPGLQRVAILANQAHPGEPSEFRASKEASVKLGLAVEYLPMRSAADLDQALEGAVAAKAGAIVVFPDAGMMRQSERIAAFSRRHRIPVISGWAIFAQRGNLLSYGPNLEDGFARLAVYVDRIVRGARPADLPVELPTKVELVINQKAARELGVTIPPALLARADEVIR